ncbi:D-altritol 5-dehydrogenase-like [Chrysoperla carnea]|uniref:D-altritol 5-dehydrogenase-like n=1 Tax=Chrysoperla carnea TaxID=189513 RepID=UPI001D08CB66|nr:D-altritol 5-dehydrogenase-like [Chrysoperla carnea]
MEALLYDSNSKTSAVKQVPIPTIEEPDDVLIKVVYSGVCGTDLRITAGEFPVQKKFPIILGHEFMGVVAAIGRDVTTFKVGDRAAVDPNKGCGVCRFCHEANINYCMVGYEKYKLGVFKHGGHAEYCLCKEDQCYKIPDSVTTDQAGLVEPLSCVVHAMDFVGQIGHRILIMGAGWIGLMWLITLHLKGHRNVTAIERNERRRDLVERLDLGYKVLPPEKLENDMKCNYTPFDFIVDCSGNGPIIELGITWLNNGGKFCIFGIAKPETVIQISPFEIFLKEITIYGIKTNPHTYEKSMHLLKALGSRYLDYEKLGVACYKLTDYEKAFEELRSGNIAKILFKFT